MSSKYVTQAEAPNRTETNKYLNASGHWTVPAGGGGGLVSYSTTEQVIGTWVDGKPLYEKTINIGALPSAVDVSIYYPIGITNYDFIFISEATAFESSSKNSFPINVAREDLGRCAIFIYSNQIAIRTGTDRSTYTGYVTIRYTKTTD